MEINKPKKGHEKKTHTNEITEKKTISNKRRRGRRDTYRLKDKIEIEIEQNEKL